MNHWIAIILLLLPCPSFAWDTKGHRVIATVAERRLAEASPDSLEQVLDLLGEAHLASVAMRAEEWATELGTAHAADRDCPFPGCLVDAVTLVRRHVDDVNVDPLQRREALIYLIHLIGDIFQPWHCTNGTLSNGSSDENGTRIHLSYKGGHLPGNRENDAQYDNVHFLWDVSLLEFERRDEAAMVEHLFSDTFRGRDPGTIYTPTTETMAENSHSIPQFLKFLDGQDLNDADMQDSADVMDEQLLSAGLNLARIIKLAFPPRKNFRESTCEEFSESRPCRRMDATAAEGQPR